MVALGVKSGGGNAAECIVCTVGGIALEMDGLQVLAEEESLVFDHGDTGGNFYRSEVCVAECSGLNCAQIIGQFYVGQTVAMCEGPFTDGGNTVRNGEILQTGAAVECQFTDGLDTVSQSDAGQGTAVHKRAFPYCLDGTGNCNFFQFGTSGKGVFLNVGDTVGNIY